MFICVQDSNRNVLYVSPIKATVQQALAAVVDRCRHVRYTGTPALLELKILGSVVQSVVSLTSSLRVISLTVLVDSIYNILNFFAEKM